MSASLTIGDFARATHISVKALRHYHELGLLLPSSVDGSSGYRIYSANQIATAQVIRRFRNLDMPLEDIRAVLHAPDVYARNALIAAHLARLERELAQTEAAVSSLRRLLEGPPTTFSIAYRSEAEMRVATVSDTIELRDLSTWFRGAIAEVYATLDAQRISAVGPAGSILSNAFFAEERGELTVFVPAGGPFNAVGRVTAQTIPAVELATIVHAGSHDDIDQSYGALAAHVAQRAIGLDGPIRERYLVGRHETADAASWRTEIAWPIFRTFSS